MRIADRLPLGSLSFLTLNCTCTVHLHCRQGVQLTLSADAELNRMATEEFRAISARSTLNSSAGMMLHMWANGRFEVVDRHVHTTQHTTLEHLNTFFADYTRLFSPQVAPKILEALAQKTLLVCIPIHCVVFRTNKE